jgi:hypothetical protein
MKLKQYVKLWGKCLIPSTKKDDGHYNMGIICEPDNSSVVDGNGLTYEMMGRRIRVYDCENGTYGNYRLDSIRKFNKEYILEKNKK